MMTVARLLPQTAPAAHSSWRVVNVRGKRRRFRCKVFSNSNHAAHSGPSYDWQCCLVCLTMGSRKTLRENTAVVKRSVACSSAAGAHL